MLQLPLRPLTILHSLDSVQPQLSPIQLEQGVTWRPAEEALPGAQMVTENISGRYIVQDNVSDCSLVAALIVGAEHHGKFGSKVSAARLSSRYAC